MAAVFLAKDCHVYSVVQRDNTINTGDELLNNYSYRNASMGCSPAALRAG